MGGSPVSYPPPPPQHQQHMFPGGQPWPGSSVPMPHQQYQQLYQRGRGGLPLRSAVPTRDDLLSSAANDAAHPGPDPSSAAASSPTPSAPSSSPAPAPPTPQPQPPKRRGALAHKPARFAVILVLFRLKSILFVLAPPLFFPSCYFFCVYIDRQTQMCYQLFASITSKCPSVPAFSMCRPFFLERTPREVCGHTQTGTRRVCLPRV